jgi:hypothetical protein
VAQFEDSLHNSQLASILEVDRAHVQPSISYLSSVSAVSRRILMVLAEGRAPNVLDYNKVVAVKPKDRSSGKFTCFCRAGELFFPKRQFGFACEDDAQTATFLSNGAL